MTTRRSARLAATYALLQLVKSFFRGGKASITLPTSRAIATWQSQRHCQGNLAIASDRPQVASMFPISYRRHRFPPTVIQHAVWLRFTLSYRDVEEPLAQRWLDLSYGERPQYGC